METPTHEYGHLEVALRDQIPGATLILNEQSRFKKGRILTAGGADRGDYEARWELWGTDASGLRYRVTRLEGPTGEFVPPGDWFVDAMRLLDPARYGGDLHKMIDELVDKPNENVRRLHQETFDNLIEAMGSHYFGLSKRRVSVLNPGLPGS